MNFRILKALLAKELQMMKRTKYIPAIIVILPIMVMIAIPRVANLDVKNVGVAVVDNDKSMLSRRAIADLGSSEYLTVVCVTDSPDEAMTTIENGTSDVMLTIPNNFSRDLTTIDVAANGVNASKGMLGAQYTIQSVLQTIMRYHNLTPEQISIINRFNPTLNFQNYMIPAITVVLIILICGFLPTLNLVLEKETGTIEAINVTPVGRFTFVLSKLIPYWLAGLIVVTVCIIEAKVVYHLVPAGTLGAIYLAAVLFSFVMSGLGIIIANRSETLLQSIFVMFAIVMVFQLMGGLFTPIGSMPQWAQIVTYAIPPRYFNEIMRAVYLKGSGIADLWPQYVCLGGIAIGLCVIAAITYKKQA